MKTQRIVTGHDHAGRSTVASSGPLPDVGEFRQFPGFAVELIWQTAPGSAIPAQPSDPTRELRSLVPAAGGSSAMLVTFPPEGDGIPADFDPLAAARELCERSHRRRTPSRCMPTRSRTREEARLSTSHVAQTR